MSDFKSKLPDFKELSSMTSKLYKGIKTSVEEIIKDYKQKRAESEAKAAAEDVKKAQTKPASESPVVKSVENPTIIIPEGTNETVNKNTEKK